MTPRDAWDLLATVAVIIGVVWFCLWLLAGGDGER